MKEIGIRWRRLLKHLLFIESKTNPQIRHWFDWPMDLVFMFLDVLWLPDLIQGFVRIWPFSRFRRINKEETQIVKGLFQNEGIGKDIRIRERIHPLRDGYFHAFVFCRNIYCVKELSLAVFVHELIHVWQSKKYGSCYIYRALKAQHFTPDYSYGGVGRIKEMVRTNAPLSELNFEQQAQVFQDIYMLRMERSLPKEIWTYFVSFLRI